MSRYCIRRLGEKRFLAVYGDLRKEFPSKAVARRWLDRLCFHDTIKNRDKEGFATWEQIADIVGISREEAESICRTALMKIRAGLLNTPDFEDLLRNLR
jgi:pyrroloquinoline quinone (PQQ) biosynthesis protein C